MFAMTLVFALPASSPAQVAVLISGGFSAAYQELLPQLHYSEKISCSGLRSH
jgi:hypothetical protein